MSSSSPLLVLIPFIEMTPYPSPSKDGEYFDCIPGENERGPRMLVKSKPTGDKLFGTIANFHIGLALEVTTLS